MTGLDFPWPISGAADEERTCARCGEAIPPYWRHYWRPCACTWAPRVCAICGAFSSILCRAVGEVGDIAGTAQHTDDVADHEVTVVSAPLVEMVGNYLDRARPTS